MADVGEQNRGAFSEKNVEMLTQKLELGMWQAAFPIIREQWAFQPMALGI